VSEIIVYECEDCEYREKREAEGTLGQIKCPDCGGFLTVTGTEHNEEP